MLSCWGKGVWREEPRPVTGMGLQMEATCTIRLTFFAAVGVGHGNFLACDSFR